MGSCQSSCNEKNHLKSIYTSPSLKSLPKVKTKQLNSLTPLKMLSRNSLTDSRKKSPKSNSKIPLIGGERRRSLFEEMKYNPRLQNFISPVTFSPGSLNDHYLGLNFIETKDQISYYTGINIKSNSKRLIKELNMNSTSSKNDLESRNIEWLNSLDCPFILKSYDTIFEEKKLYFVTDYPKNGTLTDLIKHNEKINEEIVCLIIYQILIALNYIHGKNIIQRNIKTDNIFVFETGKNNLLIKLGDFRRSKLLKENENETILIGTPPYLAPEIIKQNYNFKSDIWNVGIIMYNMISKRFPFEAETNLETFDLILNNEIKFDSSFNYISQEGKDFILRLLNKNPDIRPNAIEALKDNWFQKMKINEFFSVEKDIIFDIANQFNNQAFSLSNSVKDFLIKNININEDVRKLLNLFFMMDEEKKCRININSIENIFTRFFEGRKLDEEADIIKKLFNKVDIDMDGEISFSEFLDLLFPKFLLKNNEILDIIYYFKKPDNLETFFKIFSKIPEEKKHEIENQFVNLKLDNNKFKRIMKELL